MWGIIWPKTWSVSVIIKVRGSQPQTHPQDFTPRFNTARSHKNYIEPACPPFQDFVKCCQKPIYKASLQLFIPPFCVIIDSETGDMFSLWFSAFAQNFSLPVVRCSMPRALWWWKLLVFCVLGQSPRNCRHPAITLSVVIKSIWATGASEWQTISQGRSGGDVKTNIRIHLNPISVVFNLIYTVRVTEKKWKMKSLIHQTYLMSLIRTITCS